MNEITIRHINNLSDVQLSQLLKSLLHIEAQKNLLEKWDIFVPEKITVGDGGEDGVIEYTGIPIKKTWLRNKYTVFQCKATKLFPSKCYEEILEKEIKGRPRKLKSQIEKAITKQGCYTLFINEDLNNTQKDIRISKFRKAIQDTGHASYASIQIEIYDANSIKDWVNENVAAVTFVQSMNGINRPLKFRTWPEWNAYMPGGKVQHKTNDKLESYIKLIRDTALKDQKVLRVIGHSGLGKTRLVLESFRDDFAVPEIKALQSQLVYYDMGIGEIDEIAGYIISHKNHQSGILVADNCEENDHRTLSGLITAGGNFKLITIDFSTESSERNLIKLDRDNQRDIVKQIIETIFKETLTPTDREFLSEQSEGYPQMAILFSESIQASGLDNLNAQLPKDFIKKLVFGRNEESEHSYEIIKACSVLTSFGFLDDNISSVLTDAEKQILKAQTNYVREKICGQIKGQKVSYKEFYKTCLEYKRQGIIEQRGTNIMVKPTPLAIDLAAQWWRETPSDDIKSILEELQNNELGNKIVERLTALDQLDKAKDIVNELWGSNSPFGKAEVLNTSWGSLLFRYVVEVNPIVTANTLEVAFGNSSKDELLKVIDGRRNLIWALEKLCFREETFVIASKILYLFAVSENETWGNNATNQFIQLFQVYLSGTQAGYSDRIEVLKWGLNKNNDDFTKIAITAMGRGLQYDHLSRTGGAEKQGSGLPMEDYKPNTWQEIYDYWRELINLLTDFACAQTYFSNLAKNILAGAIRSLIRYNQFNLICDSILKILKTNSTVWSEAITNLKKTIGYEKYLPQDTVTKIKELVDKLTPNDVRNQLLIKVTKPDWDLYEKDDVGNYMDKQKLNVESLAEDLVANNTPWQDFISDLLIGEQRQGFNFGKKMGELISNKDDFLNHAIKALKAIPEIDQNPELIVGFMVGANDRQLFEKLFNIFLNDPVFNKHAFYLVRVSNYTYADVIKLFDLVDKSNISINQFLVFQYGRVLDALSNDEVIQICNKISSYGKDGKWVALTLLFMYCLGDDGRWDKNREEFQALIAGHNLLVDKSTVGNMDFYHWTHTVEKLLNKRDEIFVIEISKQIIEMCSLQYPTYTFNTELFKIIRTLFDEYFEQIWPHFGESLMGDPIPYFHLKSLLGERMNWNEGESAWSIFENQRHNNTILEWCRKHNNIAPKRIAYMMPLQARNTESVQWHPFAEAFLDEFGNDNKVLQEIAANMGTFGSVGSRVPYFQKQKELLNQLRQHKNAAVKSWAISMITYTEKTMAREKLDDEEHFVT